MLCGVFKGVLVSETRSPCFSRSLDAGGAHRDQTHESTPGEEDEASPKPGVRLLFRCETQLIAISYQSELVK